MNLHQLSTAAGGKYAHVQLFTTIFSMLIPEQIQSISPIF